MAPTPSEHDEPQPGPDQSALGADIITLASEPSEVIAIPEGSEPTAPSEHDEPQPGPDQSALGADVSTLASEPPEVTALPEGSEPAAAPVAGEGLVPVTSTPPIIENWLQLYSPSNSW